MIIDNREGKGTEYLAVPIEIIKGGDIPVPEIDYEETEGLDGITREYVKVVWMKIKDGDVVNKYDVVDHIVTAGCLPEDASKGEDGHMVCTEKSIYTVLHPIKEFVEQHVIELPETKP